MVKLEDSIRASTRLWSKGREYYLQNRVREYECLFMPDGSAMYEAQVMGSGRNVYDVEIQVDDMGIVVSMYCDCPAFDTYPGPCKHVAALALYADDVAPDSREKIRNTDAAAAACMKFYEVRGKKEVLTLAESDAAPMGIGMTRIVPQLIWQGENAMIEITVGESRQYKVRNLGDFCRAFEEKSHITFGKKFTLRCSSDSFEPSSQKILNLILSRHRELAEITRRNSYYYSAYVDEIFAWKKRAMYVTSAALDELLECFMESKLAVKKEVRVAYYGEYGSSARLTKEGSGRMAQFQGTYEGQMLVRDGDPEITLHVEQVENGLEFIIDSVPVTLQGEKYLYVCANGDMETLWRCSPAWSSAMKPFLDALARTSGCLFIETADIPRFFGSVLTDVDSFLTLKGDTGLLRQYVPEEMEACIYLDNPVGNRLTACIKGSYAGGMVNLYNNKISEPETGGEVRPEEIRRNVRQEQRICVLAERYFDCVDLDRGEIYTRDDEERVYEFLNGGQQELARYARIFVTERYRKILAPPRMSLNVGVTLESDLLNVGFELEGLPADELLAVLQTYQTKKKYHRLKNGAFLPFDDQELCRALDFVEEIQLTPREIAKGSAVLPRYRAVQLSNAMRRTDDGIYFEKDRPFQELMKQIRSIGDDEQPLPQGLRGVLRDYQKAGYQWLGSMAELGFGGILADDMGLGKTLEMISLLLREAEKAEEAENGDGKRAGDNRRILAMVVCPASLILNWERELQRFAPGLSPYVIIGAAAVRRKQINGLRQLSESERGRCVVITSYDLLKRDLDDYKEIPFQYHVIDEAQYIKNNTTKNAKAVKRLESACRFALTGTPVENRLSELWSIFDFLMPGYLQTYNYFKERYETPIVKEKDEGRMEMLKRQIMPFVLRRLKSKVLSELPEKVESVICAPMSEKQRELYLANLIRMRQALDSGVENLGQDGTADMDEGLDETLGSLGAGESAAAADAGEGTKTGKFQILSMLTRLRQLCCHPSLCYEEYEGGSGKLETCMELIHEAAEGGHRILLFSQFTSMLDILAQRLNKEKIDFYMLTGKTDKLLRQKLVNQFNDNQVPVFLISLKAGGTGLNLTGADVVIHYDPWWNRAARNQATDRAHRIGQKNSVQVYELISEGSIEEKIMNLQQSKGELADAIIGENSSLLSSMDEQELADLFR